MVSPHNKREETQDHDSVNHRFIAPEWLAGITWNDLCHDRDRRQNQNVNLRVREEPEKVLIQKWTTTTGGIKSHTADIKTRRNKETCSSHTVHELHDRSNLERRERKEKKETSHKHRPDKEWKAHPAHPAASQINDGTDEVNRAKKRRSNQKCHRDEPLRLTGPEKVPVMKIRRRCKG